MKNTLQRGWPEDNEVDEGIKMFTSFNDELTIYDDLVLRQYRIIIPDSMKQETLHKLYEGHQGINACLRRARTVVYWPNMTVDIKRYVEECGVCTTFSIQQPRESIIKIERPDVPWTTLGMDLFTYNDRNYLVLVDYTSNFIEIDCISNTLTSTIIVKLKQQFSRHGIPKNIITDNGPQFTANDFISFSNKWNFKLNFISPGNSQANGRAAAAVKTVKNLFRRCNTMGEDPYLGLLNIRNTPAENMDSPNQRMFNRRMNMSIPSINISSNKTNITQVNTATDLGVLKEGDVVRLQPIQRGEREWKIGKIIKQLFYRKYQVLCKNKILIRNCKFLRLIKTPTHHNYVKETLNIPSIISKALKNTYQSITHPTDTHRTIELQSTQSQIKDDIEQDEYTTRSGRISKKPVLINFYVLL